MAIDELQLIAIETLYAALVIVPSLIIFYKTRGLYNFSGYKGLRYFSNAFLFISLGFFLRYIVIVNKVLAGDPMGTIQTFDLLVIGMEFFIVLTGMFLLYSVAWKRFETKRYSKNLVNLPVLLIYITALIIAFIDFILETFILLYSSQIVFFSIASVITYRNYSKKRIYSRQFMFMSMFLFLVVMVINFIAQVTIDQYPLMRFYAYLITVIAVFIFLYITSKLTGRRPVFELRKDKKYKKSKKNKKGNSKNG